MNMLEALKAIKENENMWTRPVSWKGGKYAYCYSSGLRFRSDGFYNVPTSRGGKWATLPNGDEIFEEWEIVTPEQVNNGE